MKKRRWLTGILAIAIGFSAIPISALSAGQAFTGWVVDETQWTLSEDGTVITAKGGTLTSLNAEGPVDANQIDFSVAIQDVQSNVDGNVGLYYECQNGEEFFFEYNTVLHFLRIRKFSDGIAVTENSVPYIMEQGEWYDCRVRLLNSKIEFYVNNTLMLTQTENYETIFRNGAAICRDTIRSHRSGTVRSPSTAKNLRRNDWIYNTNWTPGADGEITSNGTEGIFKIESRGPVNVNNIEFSARSKRFTAKSMGISACLTAVRVGRSSFLNTTRYSSLPESAVSSQVQTII